MLHSLEHSRNHREYTIESVQWLLSFANHKQIHELYLFTNIILDFLSKIFFVLVSTWRSCGSCQTCHRRGLQTFRLCSRLPKRKRNRRSNRRKNRSRSRQTRRSLHNQQIMEHIPQPIFCRTSTKNNTKQSKIGLFGSVPHTLAVRNESKTVQNWIDISSKGLFLGWRRIVSNWFWW